MAKSKNTPSNKKKQIAALPKVVREVSGLDHGVPTLMLSSDWGDDAVLGKIADLAGIKEEKHELFFSYLRFKSFLLSRLGVLTPDLRGHFDQISKAACGLKYALSGLDDPGRRMLAQVVGFQAGLLVANDGEPAIINTRHIQFDDVERIIDVLAGMDADAAKRWSAHRLLDEDAADRWPAHQAFAYSPGERPTGRPPGSGGHYLDFVRLLLEAVDQAGGELSIDKHLQRGTLIDALELLRPYVPGIPKDLKTAAATLDREKARFMRRKRPSKSL